MNELGVSGSTIMSDAKQFKQLFEYQLGHIEIGEFKNKKDFKLFFRMLRDSLQSFGIHSPILRGKSKYDIIEHVHYHPDAAIKQIEKEARLVSRIGGRYLLIHFPFFAGTYKDDVNAQIEDGLKKLSRIQKKYNIPIVCEPKLGENRSPWGVKYLHKFPVEIWRKYDLKICIDIGDYVMAVGENDMMEYITKWEEFIKVVHLHNVDYPRDDYHWKPMHIDDETDGHHKLADVVEHLAALDNIYFVLEHTPHMKYSMEYIMAGKEYVNKLIFNE